MNKRIENINFKKVIIVYLVTALIIGVILCAFTFFKYKDKINFLYNYHSIAENFKEEKVDTSKIKDKIKGLANYNDIVDIVILDSENNITYSLNNKYSNNLTLTPINSLENYFMSVDGNTLFRLIKSKELVFNTILNEEYNNEYHEEDDKLFYEKNINTKNSYFLCYSINKVTGEKIYFIMDSKPVTNGALYLKIDLAVLAFYFMLYWVIVALMIYQNALKLKLNQYFWGGLTLFTNILGVIIYLLFKNFGTVCKKCNTYQNSNNVYCTYCGNKLNDTCKKCHHIVKNKDIYCSNCGEKKH